MASPTATPMEYPVEPEFLVPLPPDDLMFDDGEPWESNRHRIAINVLIRSAQQALASRADVFIGGNLCTSVGNRPSNGMCGGRMY